MKFWTFPWSAPERTFSPAERPTWWNAWVKTATASIVAGLTPETRAHNLANFPADIQAKVSIWTWYVQINNTKVMFINENNVSAHIFDDEEATFWWMKHDDFNTMLRGLDFESKDQKNSFCEWVLWIRTDQKYRVIGPGSRAMRSAAPTVLNDPEYWIISTLDPTDKQWTTPLPVIRVVVDIDPAE